MREKKKESRSQTSSMPTASISSANISDDTVNNEDFTEMVKIQEKLENALLQAEKASLAKDIFLANINHDLRTPMNCIMGFSELALEGDISPQIREYLCRIVENTERLLRVINNISYMSKTETFNTLSTMDEAQEKPSIAAELEKPVLSGVVLVCEDNRINQQIIIEHLAKVGLNAEIAENGLEGIEKVKMRIEKGVKPFDLILMDIYMPVMNGIEASQKIIELGSETPVIAMTAGTVRDKEFYKTIGMKDFVNKPFTPQELWRCLTKHLNTASPEKDQLEDADEKLKNQLNTNYAISDKNRLEEIAGAIKAGDITLAHKLAHTSSDDARLIGKTASTNIKECAATYFYRAIARIAFSFLNMEQAILDDLFAKATAR